MPQLECPDCGGSIGMHELETNTVAQTTGFATTYRCPLCGSDFPEVGELLTAGD